MERIPKHSATIRVCGVLRFLSNLCRLGRRAELLPSLPKMLSSLDHSSVDATTRTNLPCHLRTKLVQRIGLLLCPIQPQLSIQRRQSALQSSSILTSKPSKKLADNLAATPASSIKASFQAECDEPHACISVANISSSSVLHPGDNRSNIRAKAPEDLSKGDADSRLMADGQALVEMGLEIEVIPDQVAEVIDFLIDQMRSQYTVVRCLGRICARLPPTMCYDVLSAVLSLCTRFEPHTAWHGACLTLAELGRRGLLPPDQLAGVSLTKARLK
ncbi:unnamed protein product [Protopolystoma xenopodis]|uniref:Tubulin-folding cofactor D ARM repeats domain-containing protein n=1 Tax=Protopolystoma xenopodis TaxID=117903 RepID=A0A448WSR5_9PLAT|nr:unnamed protein product [Protopolystoma xenopodis]